MFVQEGGMTYEPEEIPKHIPKEMSDDEVSRQIKAFLAGGKSIKEIPAGQMASAGKHFNNRREK